MICDKYKLYFAIILSSGLEILSIKNIHIIIDSSWIVFLEYKIVTGPCPPVFLTKGNHSSTITKIYIHGVKNSSNNLIPIIYEQSYKQLTA